MKARGFTLVELLAVLGIVAVLVAMSMPLAELAARRERERELKQALWEIREAIDTFKRMADAGLIASTSSGYPPTLQTLVDGVDTTSSGHVYFLRQLPVDPFAETTLSTNPGGWALRSYQSSAAQPQPGDDVYDIHSTSTLTGLNGVPLRQW